MATRSDLIALLTAYRPADAAEQRYLLDMLDLAAVAHDPFDRTHYEPGHFTASAFVVHPAGGQILLVHHARLGIWLQPGGHVDPGDASPLEAAQRELLEETGISGAHPVTPGIFDVDVHEFPGVGEQPRHRHFDLRFAFVAGDDTLEANSEVLAAAWVTPGDLDELGVDESVRRPVRKVLGGSWQ